MSYHQNLHQLDQVTMEILLWQQKSADLSRISDGWLLWRFLLEILLLPPVVKIERREIQKDYVLVERSGIHFFVWRIMKHKKYFIFSWRHVKYKKTYVLVENREIQKIFYIFMERREIQKDFMFSWRIMKYKKIFIFSWRDLKYQKILYFHLKSSRVCISCTGTLVLYIVFHNLV